MTKHSVPPGMSRGMTFLFALAGGSAVGNLYWAQPLLAEIAASLGVSLAAAGALITATQVGYACGVLLLVPLGDALDRRRLIPAMLALSALALLACAAAPGYWLLVSGLLATGATAVSGQLLLPLAGDLSRDDQRGRVVGSIASGILVGILLSRTVSGFVAEHFGWRAIYVLASAATAILAAVVAAKLPRDTERHGGMSYPRLLASIVTTVTAHRAIGVTLFIGACSFGVFTMFWTGLTFLLSSPPFSYSLARIGLVGLVGLAGALAARQAGRLHDLGWSSRATGAALFLALVSLALAAAGARSIVLLLAAVLLVDVAIQGIAILNQTRLFSLAAQARSRVNTAYVVCNFTGGAIGSLLAGTLWEMGGWPVLVGGQATFVAAALLAWTLNRATLASADVPRR